MSHHCLLELRLWAVFSHAWSTGNNTLAYLSFSFYSGHCFHTFHKSITKRQQHNSFRLFAYSKNNITFMCVLNALRSPAKLTVPALGSVSHIQAFGDNVSSISVSNVSPLLLFLSRQTRLSEGWGNQIKSMTLLATNPLLLFCCNWWVLQSRHTGIYLHAGHKYLSYLLVSIEDYFDKYLILGSVLTYPLSPFFPYIRAP